MNTAYFICYNLFNFRRCNYFPYLVCFAYYFCRFLILCLIFIGFINKLTYYDDNFFS